MANHPTIEVGMTIRCTQAGKPAGFNDAIKPGAMFYVVGHRWKSSGSSGMVGMWKLTPVRGGGRTFETPWLGWPEIVRLAPIQCPGGCGGKVAPYPDGTISHHGSLGWSCDGKAVTKTGTVV